ALLALGRPDEAAAEYRRLVALPEAPPEGWTGLARALLLRNVELPEAQRDWRELEQALDRAARAAPRSADLPVLRAEALRARDEPARARDVLEGALRQQAYAGRAEQVKLRVALAGVAARTDLRAALEVLEKAGQELGDAVELRLARAQLWDGHGAAE